MPAKPTSPSPPKLAVIPKMSPDITKCCELPCVDSARRSKGGPRMTSPLGLDTVITSAVVIGYWHARRVSNLAEGRGQLEAKQASHTTCRRNSPLDSLCFGATRGSSLKPTKAQAMPPQPRTHYKTPPWETGWPCAHRWCPQTQDSDLSVGSQVPQAVTLCDHLLSQPLFSQTLTSAVCPVPKNLGQHFLSLETCDSWKYQLTLRAPLSSKPSACPPEGKQTGPRANYPASIKEPIAVGVLRGLATQVNQALQMQMLN